MVDENLRVGIDGRGARRGASEVVRALNDIKRATQGMQRSLIRSEFSMLGLRRQITETQRPSQRAADGMRAYSRETRQAAVATTGLLGPLRALISLLAAREVLRYADAWQTVQNRIRVVTRDQEAVAAATEQLFQVAQITRTPIEALATLYGRVSLAAEELGVSTKRVIDFTELVGKALAVQGTTAFAARGALIQLGQALGEGTVRAQEFNALLENAFPLLVAAAQGLDRAGGSVSRLRSLVIEGELSSTEFFEAIERGSGLIETQFARTTVTISQAFTKLQNSFSRFTGELERQSGIFTGITNAVSDLSAFIDDDLIGVLENVVFEVDVFIDAFENGINNVTRGFDFLIGQGRSFRDEFNRTFEGTFRNFFTNLTAFLRVISVEIFTVIRNQILEFQKNINQVVLFVQRAIRFAQKLAGTAFFDTADDDAAIQATQNALERINEQFRENLTLREFAIQAIVDERRETIAFKNEQLSQFEAERRARRDLRIEDEGGGGGRDADALRNKLLRENKALIESLKSPQQIYIEQINLLDKLFKAQVITLEQYRTGLANAAVELDNTNDAVIRQRELLEQGKELTLEVRTAQEVYNDKIREYNELLNAGAISSQTFQRAQRKAFLELLGFGKAMDEIFLEAARGAQRAFADFLFDPFEDGVRGMVRAFAEAMRRMLAEALAAQAIAQVLSLAGAAGGGAAAPAPTGGGGGATVQSTGFTPAPTTSGVPRSVSPNVAAPQGGGDVTIVNEINPQMMVDAMNSAAGQKAIRNQISANPGAIRRALQQ